MLFERYVAVDWSAASRPVTGPNSVWFADLGVEGDAAELRNPAARFMAIDLLDDIIRSGQRTLVGIDAALGYPAGTAALFGLASGGWSRVWDAITDLSVDDSANSNNRFEVAAALNDRTGDGPGPFWGAPSDRWEPALLRTKPASFPVDEFRTVERRLRAAGRRPASVWQLFGAGSVGGQTLTLIPYLQRRLGQIDLWPFTTGVGVPDAQGVVVAEVWPTLFIDEMPPDTVRDAAQVAATARALRSADRSGELRGWFTPGVGGNGSTVMDEGWVLGVR